ncbi:hypothetical protein CRV24_007171 [Beauveria bassiana]|nr:hypothetical protein CRV24_007171 [Beauveria bassiana]KAH8712661.1 hypothetical protein HC256_005841 [Beauveria bassiana]
MVLDPFVALGLAGNIVQFVDSSWNVISGAQKTYESVTGSSEENYDLEVINNTLRQLSEKLRADCRDRGRVKARDQDELKRLAKVCTNVAGELLEVLNDLEVKSKFKR